VSCARIGALQGARLFDAWAKYDEMERLYGDPNKRKSG
jgi:hypothetical protein